MSHLGKQLLRKHRRSNGSVMCWSSCTTGNQTANVQEIPSSDFETSPSKFNCFAANRKATVKPDKPAGNKPYSPLEVKTVHNWSTMKICEKQLQSPGNRFGVLCALSTYFHQTFLFITILYTLTEETEEISSFRKTLFSISRHICLCNSLCASLPYTQLSRDIHSFYILKL